MQNKQQTRLPFAFILNINKTAFWSHHTAANYILGLVVCLLHSSATQSLSQSFVVLPLGQADELETQAEDVHFFLFLFFWMLACDKICVVLLAYYRFYFALFAAKSIINSTFFPAQTRSQTQAVLLTCVLPFEFCFYIINMLYGLYSVKISFIH